MYLKNKNIYLFLSGLSLCLIILFVVNIYGTNDGGPQEVFEDYQANIPSGSAPASHNSVNEALLPVPGPRSSSQNILAKLTNIDSDINLLTKSNEGDDSSHNFEGKTLTEIFYDTDQTDEYISTPYYALKLVTIDTGKGWGEASIDENLNTPESLNSYDAYTALITFGGTNPFTAYGSTNYGSTNPFTTYGGTNPSNNTDEEDGNGELDLNNTEEADPFSPQTTSTTVPIPEPATLLLLGSGLIVLFGFKPKK